MEGDPTQSYEASLDGFAESWRFMRDVLRLMPPAQVLERFADVVPACVTGTFGPSRSEREQTIALMPWRRRTFVGLELTSDKFLQLESTWPCLRDLLV
ncbi:hypothetical protein Bcav_3857 [Beutenbergia cavernae DSM 12333]|uniref:Uncharacterized protein n=1 Tax=Beutenbergia cavernae (strain ATCC BAA-8 / DSM 12333 / CCUG 43141 / JCM 11478 / NBRC 16432 / NCIMB 13614 / HKI 0122) TaxID=471853 RepID=C5C4H5_BEUC1|nr:hypothetical protein [Beutenbergia cavernae]ACQ82099.1 hypothetical protein Bcav_3857 [Beutenbergia cavernae DSM 12333]